MESAQRKSMVTNVLKDCIRRKLEKYKPETKHMPFHYRLLGKDRMALFYFIQSLNRTFSTSIYEPVAIALAEQRFKSAISQAKPHNLISADAHRQIQSIMDGLTIASRDPDKIAEVEEIRSVCQSGGFSKVKLSKIDIWLETNEGELFLIDLKTVKPNIGDFQKSKRTLLEWVAAELAENPDVNINTMIGIPYNPYEPKPYEKWKMVGIVDISNEILVAEELWDFIGGEGTYHDLLDSFEMAGIELAPEIDEYFSKFK